MLIAENPSFIDEERGFNPPLGILYLAAYLLKYSKHEVMVIDSVADGLSYKELLSQIKAFAPDIVGITAMTLTLIDVLKAAQLIKKFLPQVKIIAGGPHPTIYPEETLNLGCIDYVVMGEGEKVFLNLVNSLTKGDLFPQIKGLAYKAEDTSIKNFGMAEYILDLDGLPHPARHLTQYKKYYSILTRNRPITTMITSRGCPFNCAFCNRPHMGSKFRARSADNMISEFIECLNLGIKEFLIYDDTFTIDRHRVMELCEKIVKNSLSFPWDIRTRIDTVDEKMLTLLKKAGCVRIHYGVESGCNKVLKELNKGIVVEQAEEVFRKTKEKGISTLAYFMIGCPSETEEDVFETIKLLKRLKADFVHITIFTPFPATELYLRALREKVIERDYWKEFAVSPNRDVKIYYWEKDLSKEKMILLLKKAYRSFYGRPQYLLKSFFTIRSLRELSIKFKAGIKILGIDSSGYRLFQSKTGNAN